jgi:hypothetical protein
MIHVVLPVLDLDLDLDLGLVRVCFDGFVRSCFGDVIMILRLERRPPTKIFFFLAFGFGLYFV